MRTVRSITLAATALALVVGTSVGTTAAAQAAPTTYASCDAVHRVYSGGIAKKSVTSNTVVSGGKTTHRALKGNVKKDDALYAANVKLDRDKDGIACELS